MPATDLVHVATMRAQLRTEQFIIPGGPKGTRVVAEVDSVDGTGDRLNATMAGSPAADRLALASDASCGTIDVRITSTTDDGVAIHCDYGGKIDLAAGRSIAAPLFRRSDERDDWLNRNQFIGDATIDADTNVLACELYEVRST